MLFFWQVELSAGRVGGVSVVRIVDIAAELNVSRSLVSKVLSGRLGTTLVRPEVAGAIRCKAAELGYRKNASAVALLHGRHQALGVFIHRLGSAGSGIIEDMLDGITAVASSRRQRLNLEFFTTDRACRALLKGAHGGVMDGLLVCGFPHSVVAAELLALQQAGLPVVTVYNDPLDPCLPNVGIDQERVSRLATEHLIAQGCRRIGHIRNHDPRFRGYQAALQAHGLPAGREQVFDAAGLDYVYEVGEQAVAEFARRGVQLDGIVAQSDQEAVGCLNALVRAGRRVPEEVRVIGIDNAPYCPFALVPLSSVSQNSRLRGQRAVELLLQAIDGRKVRSIYVPPELVVRASTR